jgi:biopolymer transport protein ExbD
MRLPLPEKSNGGMRLTPLIDVVFLLLIFFLVATRFDEQEKAVPINLAEILAAKPISAGPSEVIVNVTRRGQFVVRDQTLSESGLYALLHRLAVKNPGLYTVQIRADRDVRFKYPLMVMGICTKEEIAYSCTVLQERS